MASNSIIPYSSSSCDIIKTYDVFVSFRGDTRNNFTDHLFGALRRKGIHFFSDVDDRKLKKGEHILPELLQAIDGSQILVVVFSKEYASSTWCLRELEKIVDCRNVSGKHVLPIFYDVTPSEVRKQDGDYKRAFDGYEKEFKEDKEKMVEVLRWRQALSLVANLSGWDIGDKPQYEEIEKIVENIQKILPENIVSFPTDDLVGIESRVDKLQKLLHLDSPDVRSLGIYGMMGIGKTTLVTVLWKRISRYFEFSYFIEDISKICHNSNIYGLRQQLLCHAPEEKQSQSYNILSKTNLVSNRRRLIVLDNVGHIDQLEKLNLNDKCLSPGSRIIIISKDRRILKDYGVNSIYRVQPLNDYNANQLFCKYAFKNNVLSEYNKLKYDVLSYLEGHPLLVKVLGRHLVDQDISQWRNALVQLRKNPKKDILDMLRISFDDLEQNEKEIFLDLACFHWYQYSDDDMMEILQYRGFDPKRGLKILREKLLITYNRREFSMPSLLIDLGKYIVKEKSPKEPRQWSRLWDFEDFLKVLLDNKASKNLEAIVVTTYDGWEPMKVDAVSKMSQLKLLELNGGKFVGSLSNLSNELRYLLWDNYPFKCLPPNFQPNNLVKLIMLYSNIKRLWKGTKALPNLKYLDLSYSKNLVEMPDFREAPNLEWLNFQGCIQLREIHKSIGSLKNLIFLNLKYCRNLASLPSSLLGLSSLVVLVLSYNTRLSAEPWLAKHFKKLCIREAPIQSQSTTSFEEKSIIPSYNGLLLSLPSFPCLGFLHLSFCNLHQIPDAIGNLGCLEWLDLSGNKFEKMPSLKKLSKLEYINLEHCKQLKYLFELPAQTHLKDVRDAENRGLYMFNCLKIAESEEWRSMSISWMIEIVEAYYRQGRSVPRDPAFGCMESVIPGNKIPRWFNNHHVEMGNSISVDATPLWEDNNNSIGVAFCVVFCVSYDQNYLLPNLGLFVPALLHVDLVTDKSDHMYLFYVAREDFIWQFGRRNITSNDIQVYITAQYQHWNLEVKKYGYRWVYESDLQLSKIASNHCKNS